MKRYYLDKLNIFETIIKAIIINILISIFLVFLFLISGLEYNIIYIYILGIIYIVIFIIQIAKVFLRLSFYISDNAIIYCSGKKEAKLKLYSITKLEEYYGINYLFGKKTIIIHIKSKRYNFVLNKDRADIFKVELEEAINNEEDLKVFNI